VSTKTGQGQSRAGYYYAPQDASLDKEAIMRLIDEKYIVHPKKLTIDYSTFKMIAAL